MARASSIIDVAIIGDARKLIGATKDADKALGGVIGSGLKILGAAKVIDTGFDIIGGALDNADKLDDALTRISGTLGPDFTQSIHDSAFEFAQIGLSAPEVATLAANFADLATAAQVTAPTIAKVTPDLINVAKAVSAVTGKTIDEVITDIGKAAIGNQKPVSEYGIVVDKALNPDARILDILDQLKAKFPDVTSATGDLEGAQDKLNAKWDNFTTKLGEALEGPLTGVVDFLNDEIDAIPHAIEGYEKLWRVISDGAAEVLSPLARVNDALGTLGDIIGSIFGSDGKAKLQIQVSESIVRDEIDRFRDRNGQGRP